MQQQQQKYDTRLLFSQRCATTPVWANENAMN